MGLALKCMEHVTAFGCVTAAYLVGNLDPGLAALGVVSGAAIIARFKEHCAKHGLDEPELLAKMQMVVLRDWDTIDQTKADRDAIVEADSAMRAYLLDCMLTREELADSSVSTEHYPKRAARLVTDRMAESYKAFGAPTDPAQEVSVQRRFALTVIENALKAAMDDQAYAARLMLNLLIAGNAAHAVTHKKLDNNTARLNRLIDMMQAGQLGPQIRASGIGQRPFVILARRINLEVDNETQALAELSATVEQFLAQKVTTDHGTNYANLVDQALGRIAEQSLRGDFDGAADESSRAFAEWEERQEVERQSGIALINANIQQQTFRRDATSVAAWVIKRLALEGLSEPTLDVILAEQERWYNRGAKSGSAFNLGVSVILAKKATNLAQTPFDHMRAFNDLGAALHTEAQQTAGERGLMLLGDAAIAFREVLTICPAASVPVVWPMTQSNLGCALKTQGERTEGDAGLALLNEAVAAFRAALTECSKSIKPTEWAAMQNNLGTALHAIGKRTGGEAGMTLLAEAVTAHSMALSVVADPAMPTLWAMTLNNLGGAFKTQGERTHGEEGLTLLANAVTAIRAAVEVCNRNENAADWLNFQNTLASILAVQGKLTGGQAGLVLLKDAVTAYRDLLACWNTEHSSHLHEMIIRNLRRTEALVAEHHVD